MPFIGGRFIEGGPFKPPKPRKGKGGKKKQQGHGRTPRPPRRPRPVHGPGPGGGSGGGSAPGGQNPGSLPDAPGSGGAVFGSGTGSSPAGQGMAPLLLAGNGALGMGTLPGLGGVILELVGEGSFGGMGGGGEGMSVAGLGAILAGWQREQERIVNRAWRRPGGLARLGGL